VQEDWPSNEASNLKRVIVLAQDGLAWKQALWLKNTVLVHIILPSAGTYSACQQHVLAWWSTLHCAIPATYKPTNLHQLQMRQCPARSNYGQNLYT